MAVSLFLAKLIGIYFLVISATLLFRKKEFESSIKGMSQGALTISGVFILLLGLAIAIGHPVWEWSWRLVITLIGYFAIFQGVMRLGFPKQIQKAIPKFLSQGYWILVPIITIIGIFLTLNGFLRS